MARGRGSRSVAHHHRATSAGAATSASNSLTSNARPSTAPAATSKRRSPRARRPRGQRRRERHERRHDGVHRVAARGDDRDRQDRQRRRGREAGAAAEQDAPEVVDGGDGERARDRRGQFERGRREAEELRARDLQPQVDRRLVDRDARARLERPDEQGVPRRAHAPHGRVVEGVRLAGAESGEPERRRGAQNRGERDPSGDRPEAVPDGGRPLRRPPFAEAPCGPAHAGAPVSRRARPGSFAARGTR